VTGWPEPTGGAVAERWSENPAPEPKAGGVGGHGRQLPAVTSHAGPTPELTPNLGARGSVRERVPCSCWCGRMKRSSRVTASGGGKQTTVRRAVPSSSIWRCECHLMKPDLRAPRFGELLDPESGKTRQNQKTAERSGSPSGLTPGGQYVFRVAESISVTSHQRSLLMSPAEKSRREG